MPADQDLHLYPCSLNEWDILHLNWPKNEICCNIEIYLTGKGLIIWGPIFQKHYVQTAHNLSNLQINRCILLNLS